MRRSIRLPAARFACAAVRIVPALACAVLLLAVGPMTAPATHGTHGGVEPAASGSCLGPAAVTPAGGALVLDGNSTPLPSVVGVSVHVDYFYTQIKLDGNATTSTCVSATAYGTTTTGGILSVALPIPADTCLVGGVCFSYSGPFGPLGYATAGPPAGFVERDPDGGTSPGTIAWDANLTSARINVTGPEVVSTGAPVQLSASAWSALGTSASGRLSYNWSLVGLEWGISAQRGPNVTVVGTDSGWTGSLSVTIEATYGTTIESAQSPVVSLRPVATRLLSATVSPSPVDLGVPVTFYMMGSGAAGYSYSATVEPGLGTGSVSGACVSTPLSSGTVNLTCPVRAAYPVAGTALPTASVSNGFSTAQLSLGPVPVRSVEQVTLSAPSLVTYPNRSVPLTVNVTNGTGSGPYGPACLSVSGVPGLTCQTQNATSWIFAPRFARAGQYELRASVVDRFGENVSSSAVVVVVPFLTARSNGSSSLTLYANQTTALSVVVVGGALPLTTWWNLSGSSGTLCWGNLASDGTISCPYPTSFPGHANLTVTLRDALGSEAAVVFRITVTAAPARSGHSTPSPFPGVSSEVLLGLFAALAAGGLLVAWGVRRRRQVPARGSPPDRVEENELERMARGRDHLLAQADPVTPRRPDELVAGWTGPPVAPEEWAEWIAALVADGSLIPRRTGDLRLVYRRAAPRPSVPTIQFDPTVLAVPRGPLRPGAEPPEESSESQGGG
jgi:hypothetical protein